MGTSINVSELFSALCIEYTLQGTKVGYARYKTKEQEAVMLYKVNIDIKLINQ